jgi:hypothetical protein
VAILTGALDSVGPGQLAEQIGCSFPIQAGLVGDRYRRDRLTGAARSEEQALDMVEQRPVLID